MTQSDVMGRVNFPALPHFCPQVLVYTSTYIQPPGPTSYIDICNQAIWLQKADWCTFFRGPNAAKTVELIYVGAVIELVPFAGKIAIILEGQEKKKHSETVFLDKG